MGIDNTDRTLIDSFEYLNTKGALIKIALWSEKKPLKGYKVLVTIGNHTSSRFFSNESDANDYVISLQR